MTQSAYDVVVAGGGTAGVIAAVQAGRAGARTLLVEKAGMLGGTITLGGIAAPGLFHLGGRQWIAGIGWELVTRCVAECGGTLPSFSEPQERFWANQVCIDPAVYALLCDEAVLTAEVTLLLHTMLAGVTAEGDGWRVTLCTKDGLETVTARVLIDATGDANAVALAGFPLTVPDDCQPATLTCLLSGYDPATLDYPAINAAFATEVQAGRLRHLDVSWNAEAGTVEAWLGKRGVNANHIHPYPARNSREKTALELAARQSMLRVFRFLRTQPGLAGLRIETMGAECGVRETATIVGKATVTVDDYTSGRVWEDAVCHACYPVDLHEVVSARGVAVQLLAEGVTPTVPRRALLPAGSRNLLAVGRCLASDRLANSALRVQATCMATGQAAGALAALAARTGVEVESIPLADLHALLRAHGAIVPAVGVESR